MIKRMINMGSTTALFQDFGIRVRPFADVGISPTQVGFAPLAQWTLAPVKSD